MYRCKVCGYIADAAQPVECPSCGAAWDRFQQLSDDEVSLLIGEMTSYGIREQDTDVTPIDDSRRIRLLAFVDAENFSPFTIRKGARYHVATGDQQWFADNIPCQRACPSHTDISRYIALIADGRYADSSSSTVSTTSSPAASAACARAPVRKPAAARSLTSRSVSAT